MSRCSRIIGYYCVFCSREIFVLVDLGKLQASVLMGISTIYVGVSFELPCQHV
jgi:hypothetical protein